VRTTSWTTSRNAGSAGLWAPARQTSTTSASSPASGTNATPLSRRLREARDADARGDEREEVLWARPALDDARAIAGAGEVLVVPAVPRRPRRARRQHPRLIRQVRQRQLLAVRQRVALRQHGRHRLAQDHLGCQVVDQRRAAEGGVDGALAQAADQARDRHLLGAEGHPGMAVPEHAHQGRHQVVGQRGEEPDPQFALLAASRATHGLDRTLGLREHRPRLAEQHGADVGELDSTGAPLEQLDPELRLQRADLLGERLLGDVQPPGRAGEVALLRDGDEVAQLAQLRRHAVHGRKGHRPRLLRARQPVFRNGASRA
jgi:hypothetical protein